MDIESYRELHETAGDNKDLEKAILKEAAAEHSGNVLNDATDWSNPCQIGSSAAGSKPQGRR